MAGVWGFGSVILVLICANAGLLGLLAALWDRECGGTTRSADHLGLELSQLRIASGCRCALPLPFDCFLLLCCCCVS